VSNIPQARFVTNRIGLDWNRGEIRHNPFKDADRVVGYALVMPREFASDVPILAPLFQMLDALSWNGVSLRDRSRSFVMG
jgi:hypothetical protein